MTRGQGTRVKLARGQGDTVTRGQGEISSGDKLASGRGDIGNKNLVGKVTRGHVQKGIRN